MVKKAAKATPNHLLKIARKERGWTQQQVADHIGAPLALNVSRWESGTAFPSAFYRQKLCLLFNKSLPELGLSPGEGKATANPNIWLLPYPRNPFFLGREDVLGELHSCLESGRMMAPSQPQALCGLGGVGKTQVALEYAYRYAQDYQAVFWLRADNRAALVAGFLEMAQALQLPERDERDPITAVTAVKGWCGHQTSWLLILDNADELSSLAEFLPTLVRGHIVVTTRTQALGRLAHGIEIGTLDSETAALLLQRRAGLLAVDAPLAKTDETNRTAALQIAEELGYLPLAIDQAGAYLEETQCGLQQYLDLYRSRRTDLLCRRGGVVQDHPDSVATTWSLSFAAIQHRSALAADLLRLCAVLHPDGIPEELFLQAAAQLGPVLSTLEMDPLQFNQAVAVIQGYSLLRRSSREHMLSIHRLVQVVLQDTMSPQEHALWIDRATAGLNAVFPEVRHQRWEQWTQCGRLLPHVLGAATASGMEHNTPELASLLTKAADYLLQSAQYEQAEPLYQRALTIYDQMPGCEHPHVAFPLNGLADLYREQGRYEQAEPLYQRALHLWETLGHKYLEIPSPLNNLALLYKRQGNLQLAEQLLRRHIFLVEQRLGPQHREVAAPLNNLAILYAEHGNHRQAEPLLQRALSIDEQTYGKEHPEVAYSLTNLAEVYREQGWFEKAEPLYYRALHIREQALGSEHPQVASPLKGLADLYREQCRFEEAEPLYQRALAILRQHAAEQLDIADILHDLARLFELRGQHDQARTFYQQALAIREQRLGHKHPHTIDTHARFTRVVRASERLAGTALKESTV
jgi:tetratricopeptide (TPR) repeat protein/transcriptional regulator with XRE-family HTH domain